MDLIPDLLTWQSKKKKKAKMQQNQSSIKVFKTRFRFWSDGQQKFTHTNVSPGALAGALAPAPTPGHYVDLTYLKKKRNVIKLTKHQTRKWGLIRFGGSFVDSNCCSTKPIQWMAEFTRTNMSLLELPFRRQPRDSMWTCFRDQFSRQKKLTAA